MFYSIATCYQKYTLKEQYTIVRKLLDKDDEYSKRMILNNGLKCVDKYVLKGNPYPDAKLTNFVIKNISSKIDLIENSVKTIGVYKRIITGMINNLENSGEINHEQNLLLWKTIIHNIETAVREWDNYYVLNVLKLPF